jgi:hypothetical protein
MNFKKIILSMGLLATGVSAFSQNGLDSIIIEKYYISNSDDAIVGVGGDLPVGSVTYRIFVDLKPGYNFQALYGVPSHELRLSTTTKFFNNTDRGNTTPSYTKNQMRNNTVMLDSWFSVGAASGGTGTSSNFGVLKNDDNGIATVSNLDGILQNANPFAGIPLTQQDGIVSGTSTNSPVSVTFVGLSNELDVFNDGSADGNLFTTTNGSIAALGGAKGIDTTTNRVLIGQFTTEGVFCYLLNIQIGTPTGGVEKYVASNPQGNEIQLASLSGCIDPILFTSLYSPELEGFKIGPNPAKSSLNIYNKSNTNWNYYKVYGIDGKVLVFKNASGKNINQTEKIDLTNFKTGVYFLEVNNENKSEFQKFIVE